MKKTKQPTINTPENVKRLFDGAWIAQQNADIYMNRVRDLTEAAWKEVWASNPAVPKDTKLKYSNGVVTFDK